jgi:hypothetical protein
MYAWTTARPFVWIDRLKVGTSVAAPVNAAADFPSLGKTLGHPTIGDQCSLFKIERR